jgi:hypothetical protein
MPVAWPGGCKTGLMTVSIFTPYPIKNTSLEIVPMKSFVGAHIGTVSDKRQAV